MEMQTAHLDMIDSGSIYVRAMPDATLFDTLNCGLLAYPRWPAELGEEPAWFDHELDQLCDWVEIDDEVMRQEAAHEQSLRREEYFATCIGDPK